MSPDTIRHFAQEIKGDHLHHPPGNTFLRYGTFLIHKKVVLFPFFNALDNLDILPNV